MSAGVGRPFSIDIVAPAAARDGTEKSVCTALFTSLYPSLSPIADRTLADRRIELLTLKFMFYREVQYRMKRVKISDLSGGNEIASKRQCKPA
jgi:hypothetical protein